MQATVTSRNGGIKVIPAITVKDIADLVPDDKDTVLSIQTKKGKFVVHQTDGGWDVQPVLDDFDASWIFEDDIAVFGTDSPILPAVWFHCLEDITNFFVIVDNI